jgi:hypothetical protein
MRAWLSQTVKSAQVDAAGHRSCAGTGQLPQQEGRPPDALHSPRFGTGCSARGRCDRPIAKNNPEKNTSQTVGGLWACPALQSLQ